MTKKLLEKAGADFQEINMDDVQIWLITLKVLVLQPLQLSKRAKLSFQDFNQIN